MLTRNSLNVHLQLLLNIRHIIHAKFLLLFFHDTENLFQLSALDLSLLIAFFGSHSCFNLLLRNAMLRLFYLTLYVTAELHGIRPCSNLISIQAF